MEGNTMSAENARMYKTAIVKTGNFLYRVGDVVAVEYLDSDEDCHYFGISRTGIPAVVVRDRDLCDFVL
jgi:hypothetical protein